jgi:uncharacterized protein
MGADPFTDMNGIFTPLTDEECDRLNRFLLDRIEEEADTLGRDEGVLDISELDGLFTALVSGPISTVPSKWLPVVWGDFEPVWDSQEEFEEILTLMIRHMNAIAHLLMEYPQEFEPMFLERVVDGHTYTIVDEWCDGYVRGVELAEKDWHASGKEMVDLLAPIYAFTDTEKTKWRGHDLDDDERESIRQAITPNVCRIHAYWLSRRGDHASVTQPVRRTTPRVGRNDPCPCGSGKKYKKCCLH